MINWNVTKDENSKISKVANRAIVLLPELNYTTLTMDLTATHKNGNPLDFDKMLAFDDENFMHDICGISRHINRNTGKLTNHFSPRCSA